MSTKAPSRNAETLLPFASECLLPRPRAHTEIGAMYAAYRVWCDTRGQDALAQAPFADAFAELCKAVGIMILPLGGLVYVLHTRVAWDVVAPADRAPQTEDEAPAELWAESVLTERPTLAARARGWFRRC